MAIVYSNGTSANIAVPANEKIAIFSNSPIELYQLVGYPNQPESWNLMYTTAAGETYTTAAFSSAATVRVNASASDAFYEVGSAPVIGEPLADQSFADATGIIQGLAAAQGGSATFKGGTSSTAGNAGGEALLTGGQPGATGVGGAATVAGGAGGATSGAGGVASITGGAGTNGNAAGGVGKTVGGAGQGTGAGGAAQLTGGASGAGATGDGGDASVSGGAAASTNGNGGSVILTGGALAGSGLKGSIYQRGYMNLQSQVAPTAKTVTAAITAAELVAGIITTTAVTGPSEHQLPTGTLLKAQFPDIAEGDSFDFSVINTGTGAAEDATLTVNTDVTIVGNPTVGALTDATIVSGSGRFRARHTTGVTWIVYRIA